MSRLRNLAEVAVAAMERAGATESETTRVWAMIEAGLAVGGETARLDGLTAQETAVARIIAAGRGRPVSEVQIAEMIGSDAANFAKVVVCRVRRARPDIGRHIKTVWREGYAWTGERGALEAPV